MRTRERIREREKGREDTIHKQSKGKTVKKRKRESGRVDSN